MVRLGALAPARSSSAQIASFGADLVEHHARANRAIGALSRELGVTLVLPPPRDEAEAARRKSIGGRIAVLELLRGDDFDRAFARVTADAHQQALDRSRDTLDETCHPRVRELLAEQVLGLERLLRTAEALSRATRVAPQAERAR